MTASTSIAKAISEREVNPLAISSDEKVGRIMLPTLQLAIIASNITLRPSDMTYLLNQNYYANITIAPNSTPFVLIVLSVLYQTHIIGLLPKKKGDVENKLHRPL